MRRAEHALPRLSVSIHRSKIRASASKPALLRRRSAGHEFFRPALISFGDASKECFGG